MTNNDILRRLRFTYDLDDSQVIEVFAQAEHEVTRTQISAWLKGEEDPDLVPLEDVGLATFLNGFINLRRGRREGPIPQPETRLSNNAIFRKLKIALNLQAEEILTLLQGTGFQMSKHELSAFFRKPGHKHYRDCKDQVLRRFLQSLQRQERPDSLQDRD